MAAGSQINSSPGWQWTRMPIWFDIVPEGRTGPLPCPGFGQPLLQPVDGRVFAKNVVADFGGRHGGPHRGVGRVAVSLRKSSIVGSRQRAVSRGGTGQRQPSCSSSSLAPPQQESCNRFGHNLCDSPVSQRRPLPTACACSSPFPAGPRMGKWRFLSYSSESC